MAQNNILKIPPPYEDFCPRCSGDRGGAAGLGKVLPVSALFARPREQPTGESILDAVAEVLRTKPVIWPEEVAKQLGVKKEHLSGAVKILTGVSLEKMIREWRMLQAIYYVRHTDMTFEEIAQKCGYSQTKTLTQAMEHYLHMTPYEYRNGCHREQIRKFRITKP